MKNTICCLCLLLPLIAFGQAEIGLPTRRGDKIIYAATVAAEGCTRESLYTQANQWMIASFISAKDVFTEQNPESGKLTIRGHIPIKIADLRMKDHDAGRINFTLSLSAKDNKYKYTLSDLYHDATGSELATSIGNLEREEPDIMSMTQTQFNAIKKTAAEQIAALLTDLQNNMSTTPAAVSNSVDAN